ncbi:TPA: hypothetical protein QCO65_005379 [Bacillus cereus]|uniref:hypothetical protein n=1 Tax=Bacillus sp. FSL H8-0545 TaxID=2921402 RepID=UPI0030FA682F|nr:hypothetical protein [Bacillus cereus]
MKKYNKCSQFSLPCAYPIPEPPEPKIYSAFRAVSTALTPQTVNAANTQVQYQTEQYDLRDEYLTTAIIGPPAIPASTFIPKSNGIYDIIASVEFLSSAATFVAYDLVISITVGGTAVASDNEHFAVSTNNIVSVSTNIQLKAGDQVQVFVTSTATGTIVSNRAATRFEATRLPSPII